MNKIHIELQKLTKEKHGRPHKTEFKRWFEAILATLNENDNLPTTLQKQHTYEMTVRIVEQAESTILNNSSRGVSKPTNVLSFPFESPNSAMDHYLGDIAMCGKLIESEAKQLGINIKEYWAHMFIHACLHLLNFDHQTEDDATYMESMENEVMLALEYQPPYEKAIVK